MMSRLLVITLFAVMSAVAAPASADFLAGMRAKQAGDHATAYKEWLKDAEAGNMHAQYEIAEMLRQGQGAPKDARRAFQWYLKSADQGLVEAQRNVGIMYGRAIGVQRDDFEAYKWLSLAAAQGDQWAGRALDFVNKRMIRELGEKEARKRIGEAKYQAAAWQPKSARESASKPPGE
ncbi:MAG: tetratricopeptide repeat protein [Alphaproteobacteria bacterium]|nr:tetratricopeptide repeat protein [Alphaproteobacteria bacterium]